MLRQPYVVRHQDTLLNVSYVLTSSAKFNETLQNIVKSLLNSGFSDKDYRQKDDMPESEKQQVNTKTLDNFLFPEDKPEDEVIDAGKINFRPDGTDAPAATIVINTIAGLAEQQNRELEEQINKQPDEIDANYYAEMGAKVKRYRIRDGFADKAKGITIPDGSIRRYVESVFSDFSQEQVADFLSRKYSYIDKIKKKIRDLADVYAEEQFDKFVKVGKIKVQQGWKFPESISPGNLGSSIGQSLYEREGAMNG